MSLLSIIYVYTVQYLFIHPPCMILYAPTWAYKKKYSPDSPCTYLGCDSPSVGIFLDSTSSQPYLDSEYWISRSGCVTFCTIILSNSILNLCVLSFYATSRVPIVSPDDTWRPETVSKNQLAYSIRRSGSPNLWDALLWKNQLPTYYCAYTWSLNCTCYTIYDILLHSISIS